LVQDKPLVAVKEDAPKVATTAAVKKVITITCAKGKIAKKFSGANPKCPSGYKKK
jgi:hypothetical protein